MSADFDTVFYELSDQNEFLTEQEDRPIFILLQCVHLYVYTIHTGLVSVAVTI
jgi:hypothetical protein